MNEWLVIDKMGDHFYYDRIDDMVSDLDLTKPQIYNAVLQSQKHFNKYTTYGFYIQRLYNDLSRPPKTKFILDKYIYYVNDDGTTQYGVFPKFIII